MSTREHIYVSLRIPCDGGESPNKRVPFITAEIRLFYPHHKDKPAAGEALREAFQQAEAKLREEGT